MADEEMEEMVDTDEEEPLDGVEMDVLHSSRLGHTSFSVNGQLVFWCGYDIVGSHIPLYYALQPIGVYDGRFSGIDIIERFPCKFDDSVPESLCLVGACAVFSPVDHAVYMVGGFRGIHTFSLEMLNDPNRDVSDLYRFDLPSRTWSKLIPKGVEPVKSNKAVGWVYKNKVYFFGGFGLKPDIRQTRSGCAFVRSEGEERGWNNQLVYYDVSKDQWVWPECKGTPSPRAAAACVTSGSRVYLFGGRLSRGRVNELYMLNLSTYEWTLCHVKGSAPDGRSWHTFDLCDDNTAVLFGGLSGDGRVLNDCWVLNLSSLVWTKLDRPGLEPRMWHRSFFYDGVLFLHGGAASNILAEREVTMAESVEKVTISPRSLFLAAANSVVDSYDLFEEELRSVPECIRKVVEEGHRRRMRLQDTF